MSTTDSIFLKLDEVTASNDVEVVLDFLDRQMRDEQKYYDLFEVLKMRARHEMGLPITYDDSGDEIPEETQRQLEDKLFEACKEVGVLLMKKGDVREAWQYLRPVGDRNMAKELLEAIPVDDENVDAIVEVALTEGVSPVYGFQIVLERYGTCNSITTFDAELQRREPEERNAAAELLVKHLHAELLENVQADIERQEGTRPTETDLLELIKDRTWLFAESSYHIDTTHLSSVIRFARSLENKESLALAAELCEYGVRLNEQYHYEGDEPFKQIYESNRLYIRALIDRDVDEALAYFLNKAKEIDAEYFGSMAIETYIDLLSRVNRHQEAIDATVELVPKDLMRRGIAPSLFELSRKANSFDQMKIHCKENEDILGYAVGCLIEKKLS